jgi:hypothetical protein
MMRRSGRAIDRIRATTPLPIEGHRLRRGSHTLATDLQLGRRSCASGAELRAQLCENPARPPPSRHRRGSRRWTVPIRVLCRLESARRSGRSCWRATRPLHVQRAHRRGRRHGLSARLALRGSYISPAGQGLAEDQEPESPAMIRARTFRAVGVMTSRRFPSPWTVIEGLGLIQKANQQTCEHHHKYVDSEDFEKQRKPSQLGGVH